MMSNESILDECSDFRLMAESAELIGIRYKSYKDIPSFVSIFLNVIEDNIKEFMKDPQNVDINLNEDIKRFKQSIDKKFEPEAIRINDVRKIQSNVRSLQKDLDGILDRMSKLRDKISFGGNYLRACLIRPKVYNKDINPDHYRTINSNIRNINRAMDWCEKILIDLFNMADQDDNTLTMIDKLYRRHHIYESSELSQYNIDWSDADNFLNESIEDEDPALKEATQYFVKKAKKFMQWRMDNVVDDLETSNNMRDAIHYGYIADNRSSKIISIDLTNIIDEQSMSDPDLIEWAEYECGFDAFIKRYKAELNKMWPQFEFRLVRGRYQSVKLVSKVQAGMTDSSNNSDTFELYGVEFKIPDVSRFISSHTDEKLTNDLKMKARDNMIKCLNNPDNIKKIEEDILDAERDIGSSDDTDEIRIDRIEEYLSKSKVMCLWCAPSGNSVLRIDIPYIKGLTCAWLEHELWISSNGRAIPYDDVEFMEQVTIDEEFTEKSHGKLKYDFRIVYDYENGHQLKVVYALDGIHITDVGDGYLQRVANDNDPDSFATFTDEDKKSHISDVQHNISKMGNMDHNSRGQKVLAIVDLVNGKRLTVARTIGPYCPEINSIYIQHPEWERIRNIYKEGSSKYQRYVKTIRVGEIDDNRTFKSTKWFKDKPVHSTDWTGRDNLEDSTVNKRISSENLKYGRGAKLDDIDGNQTYLVGFDKPLYNHPSKKDIRDNPKPYIRRSIEDHLKEGVITESTKKKTYGLTPDEYEEVHKLYGNNPGCGFKRDKDGYFCHTQRARSKSYKSISDIPKKVYEFIVSTG